MQRSLFEMMAEAVDPPKGAWLSDCGTYRYLLWRHWGSGPRRQSRRVNFVMLNPSTADAEDDDPTIVRCINYARSWGYDGIEVTNLYAFRATKPKDLWASSARVDPTNDEIILDYASQCDLRILAWGANGNREGRALAVRRRLVEMGLPLHYLAPTKDGEPVHPLMQRSDLKPIPWEV